MKTKDLSKERKSPLSIVRAMVAMAVIGCFAVMMATLTGCDKEDDGRGDSPGGTWTATVNGTTISLEIDESARTYVMSVNGESESGTFDPETNEMYSNDGESSYTVNYNKSKDTLTLTDEDGITVVFERVGGGKEEDGKGGEGITTGNILGEGAVLYDYVIDGAHYLLLETWKGGARCILERKDMCTGLRTTLVGSKKEKVVWVYNPYTGWTSQPWSDDEFAPDDFGVNMKKIGTKTVIGKQCDLYEISMTSPKTTGKIAYWKGVAMYQEITYEGMTSIRTAIKLKEGGIPDKAFTKTFDIDWIDGFECKDIIEN
jgi:hypothetical protein